MNKQTQIEFGIKEAHKSWEKLNSFERTLVTQAEAVKCFDENAASLLLSIVASSSGIKTSWEAA